MIIPGLGRVRITLASIQKTDYRSVRVESGQAVMWLVWEMVTWPSVRAAAEVRSGQIPGSLKVDLTGFIDGWMDGWM